MQVSKSERDEGMRERLRPTFANMSSSLLEDRAVALFLLCLCSQQVFFQCTLLSELLLQCRQLSLQLYLFAFLPLLKGPIPHEHTRLAQRSAHRPQRDL